MRAKLLPRSIAVLLIEALTCFSLPYQGVVDAGVQGGDRRNLRLKTTSVNALPASPKRFALIIGIDQYEDPQINKLQAAANDAKSLADALTRYAGFPKDQVILLTSDQPGDRRPTRGNILRRLSNLCSAIPKDGLLLVSFAGHGIERRGRAYLLPTDAQVSGDLTLLEETAIPVDTPTKWIREASINQVIVILDACRNNPEAGRGDSGQPMTEAYMRGFNFDTRNSDIIAFVTLYAAEMGQVAYEYTEKRQGYFTWAFVEGLMGGAANEKGEVTLAALVSYVRDVVPKRVGIELGGGRKQRPYVVMEGYKPEELVLAVVPVTPSINASSNASPSGSARLEDDVRLPLKTAAARHIKNGDELAETSKWMDAEVAYRQAVQIEPNNPFWREKLSGALKNQQKLAESEKELREAARIQPNMAYWHDGLARILAIEQKWAEAEAEHRRAILLEPNSGLWHANLAITFQAQSKWAEVEAETKEAIRLEPNAGRWHANLAELLKWQNKWTEAEKEFREAIRLESNNVEWRQGLASVFSEQNKWAQAEAEAREGLLLEPDNIDIRRFLAGTLVMQRRWIEAEVEIRRLLRQKPNQADLHVQLSIPLSGQRKWSDAEKEIKEAIRLDPKNLAYREFLKRIQNRESPHRVQ